MTGIVVASVLTPICTMVTTIVLAYIGYLKLKTSTSEVKSDVADVHTLVNARSDNQDERIEQLTGTLTEAGMSVPPPERS